MNVDETNDTKSKKPWERLYMKLPGNMKHSAYT